MATQFENDCALMAGASYISNRDPINRFPVPQGWAEKIELRAKYDSSGFEATTFQNGTNLVISFAGTNATQLGDWTAVESNRESKGSASQLILNNHATSPTH